jgi:hypothetical protein
MLFKKLIMAVDLSNQYSSRFGISGWGKPIGFRLVRCRAPENVGE